MSGFEEWRMFFNQQLTEPRVFLTVPRLFVLMAFFSAALVVAGCKSAPEPMAEAPVAPAAPVADRASAGAEANDMTATEAAIAGINDAPAETQAAPTTQLLRPDA